ncbi:MAG: AraC family transcriptional regulator [Cyanobacteria bacterium RU_5_0]|nr:AraC family transcriptional regulator [Cyanobacteria bacterium RU_5_0]
MIYQTYQPRAASQIPQGSPLSQFVEFLWYWEGDDLPKSRSCLLPIGSMELVIDLHEDKIPLFELYTQAQCGTTKGARVCGVHSKGFLIDKDQNCSVIGAHFKPGKSAAFFAIPAGELHNQIISLEELWSGSATELRDRLRSKPTIEARFLTLEQFLLSVMQPLDPYSVVDFALHTFERSPTALVSTVTDQIGFSTRHFNQIFRDRVGLTPKLYCRVRRLQHVLRLLKGKELIDWMDIAFTCGYFDQAHLIHDFRTFANCTPTEYVAKRGFHPCHVELSN